MTSRMAFVAAIAVTLMLISSAPAQCTAEEFLWGTATSAYQIEGAWDVDGKGMSIWDEFVRRNGTTIKDNSTADIACRSYEKYKEDVQLLKQLGVNSYRFSISWPRVLPNGTLAGGINEKGIQYYVNLVDELLANGIQPLATLYHWDLPLTLQNEFEGWESEQIIPHFVDYAELMFERLGDKVLKEYCKIKNLSKKSFNNILRQIYEYVKWWLTFNEPWVFTVLGYGLGAHAPGTKDLVNTVYIVSHNLLRAHAKAYRLYEKDFKPTQQGKVGITLNGAYVLPKDPSSELDKKAAQRSMEFSFSWYSDPVYFGDYPEEMKTRIECGSRLAKVKAARLPEFTAEEKAELKGSSDFFGLNYYTSSLAEHKILSNDGGYYDDQDIVSTMDPSWPGSGSPWLKVTPFGIREGIKWLSARYGNPPLVVTENGVSDNDGTTSDQHRIDFYREYIGNVTQAKNEFKCNVVGYFAWSLMDNFEWAEGYTEYFGIVSNLKDSAKWYRDFIAAEMTTQAPATTPKAGSIVTAALGVLTMAFGLALSLAKLPF
uniref:beta-glucosidase n=1 Tax=Macrostomum lignano TaxID=282301 RepID=A0A1I8JDR7_9PLAT